MNAEGTGDLTRLDTRPFDQDETRELAQWINNMIDSLESIMMQVKLTAGDVSASQQVMNDTTAVTVTSAQRVSGNISEMIHSMRTAEGYRCREGKRGTDAGNPPSAGTASQ